MPWYAYRHTLNIVILHQLNGRSIRIRRDSTSGFGRSPSSRITRSPQNLRESGKKDHDQTTHRQFHDKMAIQVASEG